MRELRVGLIGYQFMGKAHSHAYKVVNMFFDPGAKVVMKAICGRNKEAAKAAADKFGWESYETDWKKLIQRDDIDIVDVSTPGYLHCKMGVEAARAGKHVICEKPLANSVAEAAEMVRAAKRASVKNMVAFNYRRVPAIAFAKKLIAEGALGQIRHFRASYLQDWLVNPNFPLAWRMQKNLAGSGALGDLGSHIIDLALYLVGEIKSVTATLETFVKERPLLAEGGGLAGKAGRGKGKVTVDDAVILLARFRNSAVGTFEATRFATGRKNRNYFEINGSEGSVAFDLEDMNRLQYCDGKSRGDLQGFTNVIVTESTHPYLSAWWPPGHIIGWEHTFVHEVNDFVSAIVHNKPVSPDFEDGLACQRVLDAVERAAKSKKWERV